MNCTDRKADAKWKEQQKMDQTRKIYHRAVCIPLENLETLWQGYNAFENDLNKATVRTLFDAVLKIGSKICG